MAWDNIAAIDNKMMVCNEWAVSSWEKENEQHSAFSLMSYRWWLPLPFGVALWLVCDASDAVSEYSISSIIAMLTPQP